MCTNRINLDLDHTRIAEQHTQSGFDQQRTEQFAGRMLATLNGAALSLMISLGHRSGLYDAMSGREGLASQAIADAAGLNERYVREWLGAMVTGGIVDYDPDTATYRLPDEHAAFLTRDSSPNNLAVLAQYIPVLGSVEDKILHCFHHGGGVPYTEFNRFHAVMAEDSSQTTVAGLFEHILPLVDGLRDELEAGIEVLDIGCGSGLAMIELAGRYPESRFVGRDLSPEAVSRARAEATRRGVSNVRFEVRDLTEYRGDTEEFDLITAFDAIHDQARPDRVLAEINRALKPGGVFLMQDIKASSRVHENVANPIGALLYSISCMHCMTVSLAQGGMGLGAAWGEELAVKMLGEAGFGEILVRQLPHDIQNNYFIVRREAKTDTKAA